MYINKLGIFFLTILFAYLPVNAYDFMVNGLCYRTTGNYTVELTYLTDPELSDAPSYSYLNGTWDLPSSVTYDGTTYSVTSIGNSAFYNCSGLTSVTIPNSVKVIGNYAFRGCSGLTTMTIPESVTSIGLGAFGHCTDLTEFFVDNNNAYYSTLEGVLFNKDKTELVSYPNSKSDNYVIPNSVTSIGKRSFYGCTNLSFVTIPNSVTMIDDGSFMNCTNLNMINIPSAVTKIGYNAFRGCNSLTTVTIPNSVTSIGGNAFEGCTSLITLSLGSSVTSIGQSAFSGCSSLKSVTIPNSVTSIKHSVFSGCTSLNNITVESGNNNYDSRNNCNAIIETATNTLIAGCKNTTIPNSITTIGNNAFLKCIDLSSITIPNSVTEIDDQAFYGCTSLTSLTIPNSVISIGYRVFSYCSGLNSLAVESGNNNYDSRNNCNAIIETATNTLIVGCKNSSIPNTVITIGDYAFLGCTGLSSINIPNSVTTIDAYAFMNCTDLSSINIPNSVTEIGQLAFFGTALYNNQPDGLIYADMWVIGYKGTMPDRTSIVLREGCVGIANSAFFGFSGLVSVTIPNTVKTIGRGAFESCIGLTSVIIPNGVTKIAEWAFGNCYSLASVNIPNSVTSIGGSAFYKTRLTSVIIPNSVTELGNSAFRECTGLTSVTIPNSVVSIGRWAFAWCSNLTTIRSKIKNPNMVNYVADDYIGVNSIFYSVSSKCVLYVPKGTIPQYQSTEPWSIFVNIVEDPAVNGDVNDDEVCTASDVTALYNYILYNEDSSLVNGDVNCDGSITASDVTAVYNIILGL